MLLPRTKLVTNHLIEALGDSDRFVAAHVCLVVLSQSPLGNTQDGEWAGLRYYEDERGEVHFIFENGESERLKLYWLNALKAKDVRFSTSEP